MIYNKIMINKHLLNLIVKTTGKTVSLDLKTNIKVPDDRYGLHAIDVLDPDMVRIVFAVLRWL